MSVHVEKLLSELKTFRFDSVQNKIINLNCSQQTDIDEFLYAQNILDNHNIKYRLGKNFHLLMTKKLL